MDLEGRYPQNTLIHCTISNETQITLHFNQGRISATQEIRTDIFFVISKTGMCLLTVSFFKRLSILVPTWSRFEKLILVLFESQIKFRMVLSKPVIKQFL